MIGSQPKNIQRIDLSGQRFGRLVVKEFVGQNKDRAAIWLCLCDCGRFKEIISHSLRSGRTQSCGCLGAERRIAANTTHGHGKKGRRTPEYTSWYQMKQRCLNPKHESYLDYGGRGITVCERWMDFTNFLQDMGPKPSRHYSIDRIRVNGNYEPDNCRWATASEQFNNTRSSIRIEFNGRILTQPQWDREMGFPVGTINVRMRERGFSAERAITQPFLVMPPRGKKSCTK